MTVQMVDATLAWSLLAGVWNPRVFRGRWFKSSSTGYRKLEISTLALCALRVAASSVSNVLGGINGYFSGVKAGRSKVTTTVEGDSGCDPCTKRFASGSGQLETSQSQWSQS